MILKSPAKKISWYIKEILFFGKHILKEAIYAKNRVIIFFHISDNKNKKI